MRLIRSAFMRRHADLRRREAQRASAEHARRREGRPHEVLYFHQVDDPYSQLAVQAIAPLLDRYAVQLIPKVVAQPTPIAIHEQQLWDEWARRECAAMAPFYSLTFQAAAADAPTLALARHLALALNEPRAFAQQAMAINAALAEGSLAKLQGLAAAAAPPTEAVADAALVTNFALRHRLGHYLGGMFYYAGEWYWGVDRLHYLEARLDALGARRADAPGGLSAPLRRSSKPVLGSTAPRLRLEFFPSLRSPYTHLAYARVAALCQDYPLDLVVRPVLPMMMRGVKADRRKGAYIIQDTAREAERLGISFGKIWDPFGKPVLRGYSLFPWAQAEGRGFEYLHSFSEAVWGEGMNAYAETGLQMVVERAGLNWTLARTRLDNRDWKAGMESNVQDMIAAGSWGVPTLRLTGGDEAEAFTVWGQDRIWLIEEEVIRRLGKAA